MRGFSSALTFLTVLPFGRRSSAPPEASSLFYFPVVGMIIGGLLAAVDGLGSLFLFDPLRALLDVAFLALLTGGLHLDGLADSADALYLHHDREKALEIMKDPRVGVMGVLVLIFCLGFKLTGLWVLNVHHFWIWFLVVPGLARSSLVVALVFMEHARPSGGVGKIFYQKGRYGYLLACLIPLTLPFTIHIVWGLTVAGLFAAITFSLMFFFQKRLRGMTGDTLGAMTETVEAFFWVVAGLAGRGVV